MSVKEKLIEILKQYPDINGVTIEGHDFDTVNKYGHLCIWWDTDHVDRSKVSCLVSDIYTTVSDEDVPDYDSIYTITTSRLGCNCRFDVLELERGVDF